MTGNDIPAFRPKPVDLITALGLLTRVPLPGAWFDGHTARPAAFAAWAYPLVGLLVGTSMAATGLISLAIGLPPSIAALLSLLVACLITGALHEDGLADCADGFWGGWTKERRLEIMKDSQIGTYGVLALILSFGLRWAAIATLMAVENWGLMLCVAAIAARAAMVWLMIALPPARATGLSHMTGTPPRAAGGIALGMAGVSLLAFPMYAIPLAICASLAALATGLIARRKIGGQTGDVLGATQNCVEIALLLAFTALTT